MYGTTFDCGIEKTGDNHVIKFYTESINDAYLPKQENNLEEQMKVLFEIVFNPLLENGIFVEKYVQSEKENIKQKIKAKIDNRELYAQDKCIETMYEGQPYALYKYGNEEDLENITSRELYQRYLEILQTAKIDIFVSGNIEEQKILEVLRQNPDIQKLKAHKPQYVINNEQT